VVDIGGVSGVDDVGSNFEDDRHDQGRASGLIEGRVAFMARA